MLFRILVSLEPWNEITPIRIINQTKITPPFTVVFMYVLIKICSPTVRTPFRSPGETLFAIMMIPETDCICSGMWIDTLITSVAEPDKVFAYPFRIGDEMFVMPGHVLVSNTTFLPFVGGESDVFHLSALL